MVPARFVALDALPLTPNGKVDRRALAAAGGRSLDGAGVARAPEGSLEQFLAAVWTGVLRCPISTVDDDFLTLGGDSILAIQVASQLRDTLGVDCAPTIVLEHPTIAALAEAVRGLGVRLDA
jgi:hypothetical protein